MKMFTVILLTLVISLPLFSSGREDKIEPAGAMMMAPEDKMEEKSSGPVQDFADMNSAMMLAEKQPTVLFFYASWCPTCQAAEKDFQKNRSDWENINLLRVDYDHSADLQKKYGVTYQHTFVQISPLGDGLVKWNGGSTKELLMNIVKEDM